MEGVYIFKYVLRSGIKICEKTLQKSNIENFADKFMQSTDSKNIYSVSAITRAIKSAIEPAFRGISVQGEISNLKQQASGHIYFSLKDAEAQLSAVLFRGNAAKLNRLPKDGDQIIAIGEISLYEPRGSYQLVVRELQFAGVGELLLKLHRLKEELATRGYFDEGRKKKLPLFPKKIGVVTSPTGAVIQDILHVLQRRFSGFNLILNPVKVQGEGAAQEIAQAINDFNRYELADVLIVGRGGGSIEDLWAFNEECVVKAVFESNIPIVSAVGHETDFTLCDLASDVRAPTPSAAAELVTKEKEGLLQYLQDRKMRLRQHLLQELAMKKQRLADLQKQPVFYSPYALIGTKMQKLDEARSKWENYSTQFFQKKIVLLQAIKGQLNSFMPMKQIERNKERLFSLVSHLRSLDPKNLLKKGYSILFHEKDRSLILSSKTLAKGDRFYALFPDGKLHAVADQKKDESK